MTHSASPSNPWFSMWLRPRETIQAIIDRDPKYLVLPLAALYGVWGTLYGSNLEATGLLGILLAAVGGGISGIIFLYFYGYVLNDINPFGGKDSRVNVRAPYAWSSVPVVWGLLLRVPMLLVFESDVFAGSASRVEAHPVIYQGVLGVETVIQIWALVVFFKCLGQVQGFSTWLAAGSALIALAIVAMVAFVGFLGLGGVLAGVSALWTKIAS